MLHLTLITVGTLKEDFLRAAAAEYQKRLSAFCRTDVVELKEARLPDNPSAREIETALEAEGDAILAACPARAVKIALCVEGRQFSSEELAEKIGDCAQRSSDLCLIIGSSYGLSPRVKEAADLRLSISKLTFPHQLMRVILLEALYRAMTIRAGIRYHK